MNISLQKAKIADADTFHRMQVDTFREQYQKYRDTDTSPAAEPVSKVQARLEQPFTYFYFILTDEETVGAIRVTDCKDGSSKRISPLFVLPAFRSQGFAQAAIREAERLHGAENWTLSTILQERGNCYLYEKMGYRQTGETQTINDRLTLVFYQKD